MITKLIAALFILSVAWVCAFQYGEIPIFPRTNPAESKDHVVDQKHPSALSKVRI